MNEGGAARRASRAPAGAARRRRRRLRRLAGALSLLGPVGFILASDAVRRGATLFRFDREHTFGYLASIVGSAVFWGVLLYVAARRRGLIAWVARALFLSLFTLSVGLQGGFWALFHIYLGSDAQLAMASIPAVITAAMPLYRPAVILQLGLAFAAGVALLAIARRFVRPRRLPRLLAPALVPAVLYAATVIPVSYHQIQSTTPDLIYFHGLTAGMKEQLGITPDIWPVFVQRRTPERVPRLSPRPARPRNVLLLLQESQRADVTCVAYDPGCKLATPASNQAAPDRFPLLQMRSNASATAISISNLLSGVAPNAHRDLLLSTPLLWEYASAAGVHTAYWTSQHLMFGNSRLYVEDAPLDRFACATTLDPQAEMFAGAPDSLLSDRVIDDWDKLGEPFFAVVQYSNIHIPRRYDARRAPFQPASNAGKLLPDNEKYQNYYKDVVYLSDLAVAKLLRHVRATPSGARTVIVYTSDHGESYREHDQAGEHSSSVFDEELRVPAWIDAPPGTLSREEEASLSSARTALLWHLDLGPTFLDLLGVWDDPALAPFRARMIGHPVTRPERTVEPVPVSNVSWLWEDPLKNWGLMKGPVKILAGSSDRTFRCFNVLEDPEELDDLGEEACAPLPDLGRRMFKYMPSTAPAMKSLVKQGKELWP